MKRSTSLLFLAFALATAIVVASDELRPVCTKQNPKGSGSKDRHDGIRQHVQEAFGLPYTPAFVENRYSQGSKGWQCGEDLIIKTESKGEEPRAFLFLHGAGMESTDDGIRAFMNGVLQEFGGDVVIPQALPKFDFTVFYPEHEGDKMQPNTNAITIPGYSTWTNLDKGTPDGEDYACFPHATPSDDMWTSITDEHFARIYSYIKKMLDEGVPAKNIYVIGFSIGAVMSQHVIARVAAETGVELGGAVGMDGGDVNRIASKETYDKIKDLQLNSLYFMYSNYDDHVNQCLMSYPGFNRQLLQVEQAGIIPHAVYVELIPTVVEWIRAPVKADVTAKVHALWETGMHKIHDRLHMAETATTVVISDQVAVTPTTY
eukprot:GFYU01023441.1.p1 GENE.GFYU01023441.1~~GFYU01023441.1.p1  ORF type:complete len:381 (+),score=91.56 GFYU01023441.1:24-1145(+)